MSSLPVSHHTSHHSHTRLIHRTLTCTTTFLPGTWEWIASAVSNDGKNFTRVVDTRTGKDTLFREADHPEQMANTRDPMLLPRHGGGWHAFYVTCYGDFHRETDSLDDVHGWSANGTLVAYGGNASGTSSHPPSLFSLCQQRHACELSAHFHTRPQVALGCKRNT
jgi:hypothetical protein